MCTRSGVVCVLKPAWSGCASTTCATAMPRFLVNSGRTLYEVQQILGHSDAKVTERYAHLSSKTLQEAANTASVIIQGAGSKAA